MLGQLTAGDYWFLLGEIGHEEGPAPKNAVGIYFVTSRVIYSLHGRRRLVCKHSCSDEMLGVDGELLSAS